ncbi:uncharacterized protein LOC130765930 [Actinidia eriantha]|uniref:uncharacterized protein LOC130765930 n=1 Tax=Actinidia eriantha TaxID=165200 RepID=UPI00258C422B|nr:uncharacterized protein LOC130765930 [Actinidia eriantha]
MVVNTRPITGFRKHRSLTRHKGQIQIQKVKFIDLVTNTRLQASGLKSGSNCDVNPTFYVTMDEDTVLLLDDIKQVQSFTNAYKETPCQVPISQSAFIYFQLNLQNLQETSGLLERC